MIKVNIEIYSTNFTVKLNDGGLLYTVKILCDSLTTYSYIYNSKIKRPIKQTDKLFYAYDKYDNFYRFPISTIKDYMLILGSNGVTRDQISVQRHVHTYTPNKLDLKFNQDIVPREDQHRYIDAIRPTETEFIKLVDLFTGLGKSLIGNYSVIEANYKTMIMVLPKYIEKWYDDVKKYSNVSENQIYIVRGSESFINLMSDETDYKYVIISIRTVYNYIKSYEEDSLFSYPIKPHNLMEKLGFGTILNDETHQEFFAVFKALLYFNPRYVLGLSATLDTKQAGLKRMYDALFPGKCRISNLAEYDPYLVVHAIRFRMDNTRGLIYKGPKGYSHNTLEQSIMRNNILLRDYIDMIIWYLKEGYINRKRPGDKALIFAASIKFCTLLTNYIQELYPSLDVRRYVEEDDYSNVLEADICISTNISAGTAIDIPNLISVYQTVSIGSLQANKQSSGRLREIKGFETRFYYFYSSDIKRQYDLHIERKEAIAPRTKTWINETYFKNIRNR